MQKVQTGRGNTRFCFVHLLSFHLLLAFRCLALLSLMLTFCLSLHFHGCRGWSFLLCGEVDATYHFHLIFTRKFVFVCLFYVCAVPISALTLLDIPFRQW
ncbi:hypothetical protein BKA83DRAFT_4180075 [Pisolithus microcarpus]|nr:hypothetical protein BKA83DRAFT_4180075 [Pisolithus microcarpus]